MAKENVNVADELKDEKQKANLTQSAKEAEAAQAIAGTYKWDRIETTQQFIAENDLTQNVYSGAIIDVSVANKITDEGKAALQGKKWVLRFAETSYSLSGYPSTGSTFENTTLVGDVTILRLKFETDGITYNLGTIDNKQSGSDDPVNDTDISIKLPDGLKRILMLILGALLLIVLLVILMPILPTIISAIIKIILLPFKLISAIFKAIFHKKE